MSLLAAPIVKDEALVLRWFPVTDSSRVVVWFTTKYGRISTLIKGSQRPKSWLLGQYDLFYTCELLFYARSNEDLHMIRECYPINRRPAFRNNWRACAGASFVSDLLYRISPPMAVANELYTFATQTLDHLEAGNINPALLFWFELKVLDDLGLAPDLSQDFPHPFVFDYRSGRPLPTDQNIHPESLPLSRGCLSLLRNFLEMDSPEQAIRLRLQTDQIREISRHLDRFSEWHLDLRLPSRAKALELMIR
ncbi:DNA repair protein RecO [Kiritimatiellaeota bacterium B1221]|nr:DNA repair protein RecO [Kiritimatiellaeota bacterium B1221]